MKGWTVHLKPGRPPVLLKEGWSWGAFLLGPAWLLWQRAWIPAVLYAAALVGGGFVVPSPYAGVGAWTLAFLAGVLGRDLVRWSLALRGYELAHVVSARDEESALGRLLSARPDVAAGMAGLLR